LAAGSSISLALFDLGGVVCRFRPERRLGRFAAVSGKPPAEVRRLLWESGFSARCDRGELNAADMHAEACARLGSSLSYAEFRTLWASAFEPDPALLALVDRVRRGRRTGLLTDNPAVLREALEHELEEVGRRFDLVFFSCQIGCCKPEPDLFRAVLARVGLAPENVLFVDDAPVNLEAAARLGITALRFETTDALERELLREGVLTAL
jgi:putative hydrolase of the HAD superfamily